MRSAVLLAIGCLAVVAMAGPAQAGIVNGGFESGQSPWQASPGFVTLPNTGVTIVNSFTGFDGPNTPVPWNPIEGNSFAVLRPGDAGVYTTLSQVFSATASQTLSFYVFWDGGDYLTAPTSNFFNDDGYVRLTLAGSSAVTLYDASIAEFGDYGNDGWRKVERTIGTTGEYTIEAGVRNVGDGGAPSWIGLDNVVLADPSNGVIPEPASLAIWGALGGLGLISARRTRKQAV